MSGQAPVWVTHKSHAQKSIILDEKGVLRLAAAGQARVPGNGLPGLDRLCEPAALALGGRQLELALPVADGASLVVLLPSTRPAHQHKRTAWPRRGDPRAWRRRRPSRAAAPVDPSRVDVESVRRDRRGLRSGTLAGRLPALAPRLRGPARRGPARRVA